MKEQIKANIRETQETQLMANEDLIAQRQSRIFMFKNLIHNQGFEVTQTYKDIHSKRSFISGLRNDMALGEDIKIFLVSVCKILKSSIEEEYKIEVKLETENIVTKEMEYYAQVYEIEHSLKHSTKPINFTEIGKELDKIANELSLKSNIEAQLNYYKDQSPSSTTKSILPSYHKRFKSIKLTDYSSIKLPYSLYQEIDQQAVSYKKMIQRRIEQKLETENKLREFVTVIDTKLTNLNQALETTIASKNKLCNYMGNLSIEIKHLEYEKKKILTKDHLNILNREDEVVKRHKEALSIRQHIDKLNFAILNATKPVNSKHSLHTRGKSCDHATPKSQITIYAKKIKALKKEENLIKSQLEELDNLDKLKLTCDSLENKIIDIELKISELQLSLPCKTSESSKVTNRYKRSMDLETANLKEELKQKITEATVQRKSRQERCNTMSIKEFDSYVSKGSEIERIVVPKLKFDKVKNQFNRTICIEDMSNLNPLLTHTNNKRVNVTDDSCSTENDPILACTKKAIELMKKKTINTSTINNHSEQQNPNASISGINPPWFMRSE